MTEQEWNDCDLPVPMLMYCREKVSSRKLRLFACGCCRRNTAMVADRNSRKAIEFAEQYADGLKSVNELHGRAWGSAAGANCVVIWSDLEAANISAEWCSGTEADRAARLHPDFHRAWNEALDNAIEQNVALSAAIAIADGTVPDWFVTVRETARLNEQARQSQLLRDIFGNPFRPVTLDPRWLSTTVRDLTRTIYDQRTFKNLPILGDALMDAGCDCEEIIQHCQGPGPHVRGCWVVDLLLGRE